VGSGFRTFTAGEVLTASNVQNYLMDQSVMVFGGSAARSSAIGTANFEEGMVSYLTDTDKVEAYNGTNWVSVAPTTSQGLTLINTTSFSGVSSVSLPANTFSTTYENYRILLNVTSQTADANFNARLRASGTDDSTSNYSYAGIEVPNAGALTLDSVAGTNLWKIGENYNLYDDFMNISLDLFAPKLSQNTKFNMQTFGGTTTGAYGSYLFSGVFNAVTSFDSISFYPASGNITGKVSCYGYNF
jgi:hypothetical protein